MDILTALYDIVDLDMPCELAAIQKRPDILKLFMDEFLAESDEILDDFAAGRDDPADEDEDDSEGYFEMDDLRIDGILLTMVDNRTNNAKNIITSLREIGGGLRVLDTEIPFSVRAAECSVEGKRVFSITSCEST